MLSAFSFVFMVASALFMFLVGWCWLCFRVGCWMMSCLCGRSHRVRELRQVPLEPVVVPAVSVSPAVPPQYAQPERSVATATRRRSGGGSGVVMTVLAIALAIFAIRSFSQPRPTGKPRVRGAHAQVEIVRRTGDGRARSMVVRAPELPPAVEEPSDDLPPARASGSWKITGLGQTGEDAHQELLKKAHEKAAEFFQARLPNLKWPLSMEFVEKRLLKEVTPPVEKEMDALLGTMRSMSGRVEITPEDQKQVLEMDRRFRMEQRMLWLGEILAAVLVTLATGAVYIRLDEASKGYYTGWLRLAASSIVASAAAGLWYVAQLG